MSFTIQCGVSKDAKSKMYKKNKSQLAEERSNMKDEMAQKNKEDNAILLYEERLNMAEELKQKFNAKLAYTSSEISVQVVSWT